MSSFDTLVAEAERQPFSGWDFSYLRERLQTENTSWSYRDLIAARLPQITSLLDMGTGGGEFLSTLTPLPSRTVATEGYEPNVELARQRLEPLGVEVVQVQGAPDNVDIRPGEGQRSLPFEDSSFDLIINRHESYYPREIRRMLTSAGSFLTQQVGGRHHQELNSLLGYRPRYDTGWDLAFAVRQLEGAGLRVLEKQEEFPETTFSDIGAVAYYLKAVPWQVPGFSLHRHRERLMPIHEHIQKEGRLTIRGHLFYLEATAAPAP